jgi:polyhydroxyalkanoate synthesis repressor PhaR
MSTARTIKKYPNRRLYDTEASRYITIADIKCLVLNDIDLIVIDKNSGDDITRSTLLQVITDQELNGDAIMNEKLLTQIIRCYGRVAHADIARALEQSLRQFMAQSQNFSDNNVSGTFSSSN